MRDMSEDESFSILFRYISGENSRTEKVPMTAPVMSRAAASEHIPMTVPVVSNSTSFSFVLPSGYSLADTPEPTDRRVSLEVVPSRHLAVLRFRGRAGERAVAERYKGLSEWVGKAGLSPKGSPFLMRYNPPFIPGFLRRNEVAVEVLL